MLRKLVYVFISCLLSVVHTQASDKIIPGYSGKLAIDTDRLVGNAPHNQYVDGLKDGLWIEVDKSEYYSGALRIMRYRLGKLDGMQMLYGTDDLCNIAYASLSIEFYDNGIPTGTHYTIERNQIRDVRSAFQENKDFVEEAKSLNFKGPGIQFYSISYDESGNKEFEGWHILDTGNDADIMIDSQMVGVWKLYNADGSFKEKNYSAAI